MLDNKLSIHVLQLISNGIVVILFVVNWELAFLIRCWLFFVFFLILPSASGFAASYVCGFSFSSAIESVSLGWRLIVSGGWGVCPRECFACVENIKSLVQQAGKLLYVVLPGVVSLF